MKKFLSMSFICCLYLVSGSFAWAGPDDLVIGKAITDRAKAVTNFPQSKDVQTILRFYTKDYIGITDGEAHSYANIEDEFSDMAEKINLGQQVGISNKVADIKPQVSGTVGWVIYDYSLKIGSGGEVLEQEQGKCTAIFRKEGSAWLIQHEHCSSASPQDK